MKKLLAVITVTALATLATSAMAATIVNTKHDLSTGSTATFVTAGANASSTTQVCVFCHTPHNAAANKALWNRNGATAANFSVYTSGIKLRFSSNPGWFEGSVATINNASPSYLCMTCHDGSTTMNSLANPPLGSAATNGVAISGYANLGSSLTNDHPVSFNYETVRTNAQLTTALVASASGVIPIKTAGDRELPLNKNVNMECSTCHNVHDNTEGMFLRTTVSQSRLCVQCHVK